MKKNKKNKWSTSHMIEAIKLHRENQILNRQPQPLVEQEDGTKLPRGWQTMSKSAILTDSKRRFRNDHFYRSRNNPPQKNLTFLFTFNELGIPHPTSLDIETAMAINPTVAKKIKYFKEIDNRIPHTVKVDHDHGTFKKFWAEQRVKALAELRSIYQETQESKVKPELDLSNLTNAGVTNE